MRTSTTFVLAGEQLGRRSGQIRLHGPEDFAAMRKAGALTAEALDLIGPLVKPGVTTASLDKFAFEFARDHDAYPASLELSRLSQVGLHLDQSCRLPWHSRREAAARRRHPQHRRDPDRRRMAWRREPHVRCGRGAAAGAAPDRRHLRGDDARHRSDQARRDDGRHRLRHPDLCRGRALFGRARLLRPRPWPAVSRRAEHPACRPERAKAFRFAPACSSPSSR